MTDNHCERCCPRNRIKPWGEQGKAERIASVITLGILGAVFVRALIDRR